VRAEVDADANVIFGSTFDPTMEGKLRVSVVATGIDAAMAVQQQPVRQPTLDVIRGGVETPRKSAFSGFSAMGTGNPVWPAASVGIAAQPITMTATAQQLEPAMAQPVAVAPAPQPGEAAPEPVAAVVETPAPVAPKPIENPVFVAPTQPAMQPRPQPPMPRQAQAAPPAVAPEPPAAPEKKRAFSLFERVTGAARRAESAPPQAPQSRAIPTLGTVGSGAQVRIQPTDAGPTLGQARLGIDAPARPKASTPEDDLLEIPAFLRRQAN
jgi:cell division protein FtsZ